MVFMVVWWGSSFDDQRNGSERREYRRSDCTTPPGFSRRAPRPISRRLPHAWRVQKPDGKLVVVDLDVVDRNHPRWSPGISSWNLTNPRRHQPRPAALHTSSVADLAAAINPARRSDATARFLPSCWQRRTKHATTRGRPIGHLSTSSARSPSIRACTSPPTRCWRRAGSSGEIGAVARSDWDRSALVVIGSSRATATRDRRGEAAATINVRGYHWRWRDVMGLVALRHLSLLLTPGSLVEAWLERIRKFDQWVMALAES